MWNSVGCLWSGSLYSAGSYYISIRRKLAAGSLVRDVRGNPAWRHHRDFRLPFGMEAHSLSAFPLPSAMEPVSRSDISFHSQWTRRTQPVSSFHLEWKPIPELLPAFHPQWNPISERNIDFHSRWISHSVLSGRSIHDGSRVLLPHQAYRLKEETYGFSLRPTSLLESPSLGLHPPTPSRGEPTPTRPGEGGSD